MRRFLKSISYANKGLNTVLLEERNFRIQVLISAAVLLLAFCLSMSFLELIAIVIAITLVLSGEVINTAIEDLCNKVEPNHDPMIGKVKDIMAAYVLLSSISAFFIVVFAIFSHFGK